MDFNTFSAINNGLSAVNADMTKLITNLSDAGSDVYVGTGTNQVKVDDLAKTLAITSGTDLTLGTGASAVSVKSTDANSREGTIQGKLGKAYQDVDQATARPFLS